jgi:hypothetical protein
MKKIILAISTIAVFAVSAYAMGFLSGERTSGMNKICFYNDGSAITVKSYELCPLTN